MLHTREHSSSTPQLLAIMGVLKSTSISHHPTICLTSTYPNSTNSKQSPPIPLQVPSNHVHSTPQSTTTRFIPINPYLLSTFGSLGYSYFPISRNLTFSRPNVDLRINVLGPIFIIFTRELVQSTPRTEAYNYVPSTHFFYTFS